MKRVVLNDAAVGRDWFSCNLALPPHPAPAVVRAAGAHFDVKERLKDRGYRWDGSACVWWREVEDEALEYERRWLEDFVYRPDLRPQAGEPEVEEVTWTTRYSRPPLEPIVL